MCELMVGNYVYICYINMCGAYTIIQNSFCIKGAALERKLINHQSEQSPRVAVKRKSSSSINAYSNTRMYEV